VALPTFGAAGTPAIGTASDASPAWPVGHSAGQWGLLVVESAQEPIVLSPASGFEELPRSPVGFGVPGGTNATRLGAFGCFATSGAMTAPTVLNPGDHSIGVIVTFDGVTQEGGWPWDFMPISTVEPSNLATAVSIPGAETEVDECLVVLICTNQIDSNLTRFSGQTNADLANLTERVNVNTSQNNGGGLWVLTGEKSTKGAFGATTGTLAAGSTQARLTLALRPSGVRYGPRPRAAGMARNTYAWL
jgi:hypothetical protein